MDRLLMGSGLHGLGSSIFGLESRQFPRAVAVDKGCSSPSPFPKMSSFNNPLKLRSFFSKEEGVDEPEGQNGNWVMNSIKGGGEERESEDANCDDDGGGCGVCDDDDDDDEKARTALFDRNRFSKLLKKVSLGEAKLYAQMSYLGSLAYDIPNIKPGNLLKRHGMRLVTSSVEKRQLFEKERSPSVEQQLSETDNSNNGDSQRSLSGDQNKEEKEAAARMRASAAFRIAASYLHSQTTSILPFRSSSNDDNGQGPLNESGVIGSDNLDINSDMASLMATTDSVTAVVAAKEEVKQAVADDLNSINSAPCKWFVCDDDKTATRFFVIQGSETLASWQANLLFEPTQFEGLDVLVHRGIYEAAKGMYQQMLPEVRAHMKTHGRRARFRFTGHSLGGSLSLLINLMLLMRGEVPYTSLLPVISFGSPSVMCGGDNLLRKLGLPKSHIQAIVMHRDIVPRAFSCNYPKPATELLKAVNGNFRNHPCLNNQKLLYTPMGELLILQPDASYSPQHDLLPSGSGLYLLTCKISEVSEAEKQLRAAKNAFLNSPHPLEILSDRSAYGKEGSIQRDHDMDSYLKCVRSFIRQELSRIRKAQRQRRRKVLWPLLATRPVDSRLIVGPPLGPSNVCQAQFNFSGIVRESLKRFSRLVASQHMHLLVILLFPARMLLIGASNVISPH